MESYRTSIFFLVRNGIAERMLRTVKVYLLLTFYRVSGKILEGRKLGSAVGRAFLSAGVWLILSVKPAHLTRVDSIT